MFIYIYVYIINHKCSYILPKNMCSFISIYSCIFSIKFDVLFSLKINNN